MYGWQAGTAFVLYLLWQVDCVFIIYYQAGDTQSLWFAMSWSVCQQVLWGEALWSGPLLII